MLQVVVSRRSATLAVLILAIGGRFTLQAVAAEQRLSDLAYAGHHVDQGAVVIGTSGAAKIRISFVTSTLARVQISPTGEFPINPSPAVISGVPHLDRISVSSHKGSLVIRTSGLSLHVSKAHLRVDAFDADNKTPLTLESPGDGTSWDTTSGSLRQSRILNDAEHIYGLGEDNANRGTLDRRGTVRDMWTGQQIRSGNVTANYPVPFYLSTGTNGRGYGCYVDNVWHLRFDLGKAQKDRLTWTSPGGPLDYYIINGPSFKSIIDQYTQLTGRPTMLPLYAFGFWQSRCFFKNFPDIQRTVDRLKAGGLPLDVLVVDSDWDKTDMDFQWKPEFLGERTAEDWIRGLHANGARTMLSTKGPMIAKEAENYPEALSKGLFATDGHGKTLTTGYYGGDLMDFTHPDMEAWLTTQLQPLSKQGIDAWWLDLIEPEGEPPQAVYHAGKSADVHNTFPLLNYRTYFDYERAIHPDSRPVILGRAASAGTQRYSGIVWTGDINSDWPTFQAHIPEAQNTGLSGLPYWTNDSGGFISGFLDHDRFGAHAELYERWFEFTCFAPIARAHKAGPSEPYEYGPVVEATAKKYLQLRYRLLPYIYNSAHEAASTGLPMLRPLVLEYQNDPGSAVAKTEYLFGHDLLVAPVVLARTTARPVYFPPGRWISYDEGFEMSGSVTVNVAAPHDRIPLFVRAGSILPTAPDMMFSSEKPWDPITLDIWPAGVSTGSLYQDDGSTTAFTKGESTTTTFRSVEQAGKSLAFRIEPSNWKFGPKQWIARFHLTSVPTAVKLDGKPVPATADSTASPAWSFDAAANTLTVRLPGEHAAHALAIALDGSSHPRPAAPKVDVQATVSAAAPVERKQIAQFLPPPKLPIRIEAANFDKGGEGLGFHVAKPASESAYRQEGVPIVNSTDAGGGYAIPDLQQDDWLAYTLDANDGGWFTVSVRVLPTTDAAFVLLREHGKVLTTVAIRAPGQNGTEWTSVPGQSPFYLPPGEQILIARVARPEFQLGNFTFTKLKGATVTVEAEAGTTTVAAVNNDHEGYKGEGFVAGIGSRTSSVKIPVEVPADGRYLVTVRYSNGSDDAKVSFTPIGSQAVAVWLPSTEDWDQWAEAGTIVELKAGHTEIQVSGTGVGTVNIDQLKLITPPQTDSPR
jgi:alpha-glucosidase (family GH31 glycosyl hydrolase)